MVLKKLSKTLIGISIICGALASTSAALADIPKWGRFEASIENEKNYRNPIEDVELEVLYTSPSGRKIEFFGFWDGGDTWKIRFMPNETGEWRYESRFSDGSPGESGSFTVSPSSIPGVVQRYRQNPIWPAYGGDKPFVMRSLQANAFGNPDRVPAFVSWAKAEGYNTISSTNFFISGKVWPINPRDYQQAEQTLNYLADNNIVVFPFRGFFRKSTKEEFKNAREEEAYIKYNLARYAPYWNLLLNVGGPEIAGGSKGYSSGQIDDWGSAITRLNPFGHLLGVHQRDGDDRFLGQPWNTFNVLQGEITKPEDLYRYYLKNATGESVVYAQENLWPGNELQPFAKASPATVQEHFWVTILSGAQLNYGDMEGGGSTSGFAGSIDLKNRVEWKHEIAKRAWDLLARTPFERTKPCPDVIKGADDYALCSAGNYYLIYFPEGEAGQTSFNPAGLTARWIDPDTNRAGQSFRLAQNVEPPKRGEDWLLEISRSGSAPPPPPPSSDGGNPPSDSGGNGSLQVRASSEPQPSNSAQNLIDGDPRTRWSAIGFPQSFQIRFPEPTTIREVMIYPYEDRAYQIEVFDGDDRLGQAEPNRGSKTIRIRLKPQKTDTLTFKTTGCEGEECNGDWVGIEEVKFR